MNNKEYSIGVYEKALPLNMPWKDKLEAVKNAGFDFLEISIDESEERSSRLFWTREQREEVENTKAFKNRGALIYGINK